MNVRTLGKILGALGLVALLSAPYTYFVTTGSPWMAAGKAVLGILLVGAYFAMTVYYAMANENYITVPFLVLFVVGYWYTGLMSLLQGRFSGISLSSDTHTKPFPVGV